MILGLTSSTDHLRVAVEEVDRLLAKSTPNDFDLEDFARLLLVLSEVRETLGHAYDLVSSWTALVMEDDDAEVEDVALLHRDWKKSRSEWKNDELRKDVVASLRANAPKDLVDPETGERRPSWERAVEGLGSVWNLSGYNARIGQLRKLGIKTGDYCSEGQWKAIVHATPFTRTTDVASDEDRAGEEIQ